MTTYSYLPLKQDEIRLATLFPGNFEDPIVCQLDHVALPPSRSSNLTTTPQHEEEEEAIPFYEALSYMWGSRAKVRYIVIDGTRLFVGKNLWRALRGLRYKTRPRVLWADAICIDQASVAERSLQVQKMRWIYANAAAVMVWLGDEVDAGSTSTCLHSPAGKAVWFPKCLRRRSEWEEYPYDVADADLRLRGCRYAVSPASSASTHAALASSHTFSKDLDCLRCSSRRQEVMLRSESALVEWLCRLQYWRRLWIVQEIVSARTLYICFGRYRFSWDAVIDAANNPPKTTTIAARLKENDISEIDYRNESTLTLLDRSRKARQSLDLGSLLLRYGDAECEDPRDKVYGLLGLANDCQNGEIIVDYGISLRDLYDSVMKFWASKKEVQEGQTLSVARLGFHLRNLLL